MYSIWADGVCIHNGAFLESRHRVLSPKLTLADNAAGSLTMTLPPDSVGYSLVQRLASEIVVKRDRTEIWSGRVIDEKQGFYNSRVLTCEGELAYLNDTAQPPAEYHGLTVRGFLSLLLGIHNERSDKKFLVGSVTVTDPNDSLYRYTNYESTLACLTDKLVNRLGGHLRVRKEEDFLLDSSGNRILDSAGDAIGGIFRYLDYLADWPNTSTQTIRFGENLLDFTRNWDMTKLATVILPRGARLEESPIEALEAYTTVESVNGGSLYVQSPEAVAQYGWIARVVDWDDVSVPANLLRKARAYLADAQFESMTLELSAVDLHDLDANVEAIRLLEQIRCRSSPHGMDRYFPVTKVEIPLDKPEEAVYLLGTEEKQSLTSALARSENSLRQAISSLPTKASLLKEAKDNASSLIAQATNGFITIVDDAGHAEELVISDSSDYTRASRLWRWNINGLGYSKDGGRTYGLAMTMDGAIVADFITTGTLTADVIRAGTIRDAAGTNYWNLETGEFRLSATTQVGDSTIITASDVSTLITEETSAVVVSTDVQYGNSNSASTAPSTWTTNANWTKGQYLWTRVKMMLKDNTVQYSAARMIAGAEGMGVASVVEQYYLSTSAATQKGGSWSETQPEWVDGRYYWTRSKITWSDGTTTYTTPTLAKALTSGNQSVSTLNRSLTQQEIFNRLTNNGQTQGIYLQNGKLYINATYIASGRISSVSGDNYWDLTTGQFHFDTGNHIILDGGGLWVADGENRKIGNTVLLTDTTDTSLHGWGFNLEYSGDFLAWAAQKREGGVYYYKLVYPSTSSLFFGEDEQGRPIYATADAFNFGCSIDMHGWAITNAYLQNCYSD